MMELPISCTVSPYMMLLDCTTYLCSFPVSCCNPSFVTMPGLNPLV